MGMNNCQQCHYFSKRALKKKKRRQDLFPDRNLSHLRSEVFKVHSEQSMVARWYHVD